MRHRLAYPPTQSIVRTPAPAFEIREVPFSEVQPYASRAAREHVSISDTRDTRWYMGVEKSDVAGVAGLFRFRSMLRIKGVWVAPNFRGRGLGDQFVKHLLAVAEDECAPLIEAYVWNAAYYHRLGFKVAGTLPNGAVKMRKVL